MSALVLTAGGARGAYQVGILKRLGELRAFRDGPSPFKIIAGASAGAINGTALATGSNDYRRTTLYMSQLWAKLKTEAVFRTDLGSLGGLSARLLRDLVFGGVVGGGKAQSLLDASPLGPFLAQNLPLQNIQANIAQGHLYAIAITATNYLSGKSFTFIEGREGHPTWQKSRRVTVPTQIRVEHICASAAIPVVFQPVQIKTPLGDFYFGDGALRLTTPLSPAIRLGADRVFAISVRSQVAAEQRAQAELTVETGSRPVMKQPPLAQVSGVILNSIFLDHLDADVEHLKRINEIIDHYGASKEAASALREPIRKIAPLILAPSADLGKIAEHHADKMPRLVRYFMEGLGASRSESADLMSYVLFDQAYTRELVELGYKDASARIDEIEAFLRTETAKAPLQAA